jgi:hypothetical protein
MDIQMTSTAGSPLIWDITIDSNGCAVLIYDLNERKQQAKVASFLTLGSTPQNPDDGVDWQGFFTGSISFGELDSQIKDNIAKVNDSSLYPDYEINNNGLNVAIKQEVV